MSEISCKVHVRLKKDEIFFGNGICKLLELVDLHKSLNIASKEMEMSYSKAFRIVKIAETELGYKLLERSVGGPSGGGSVLTADGHIFLQTYKAFRSEVEVSTQKIFEKYFK